jgi:hypothetical protein
MELDEAVQKIKIGKAVCFLGAGFSRGATDAAGRNVPGEYELRRELFEIVSEDFDERISLPDIANFCKKKSKDTADKLRQLILNRFTLTCPSITQIEILSQPWRSVFTTNYDDIVEQVLGSSFKCNTHGPQGIGCCDGQTKQAPQQRGTWRDLRRA